MKYSIDLFVTIFFKHIFIPRHTFKKYESVTISSDSEDDREDYYEYVSE